MPKRTKRSTKKARTPRKLSPIPPGMRAVTPYLAIAGAADALEFYKRAFGARELTRQAMPDGKLMHASMKIGDSVIMMADEFPGSNLRAPANVGTTTFMLHIYTKDVDKLWTQALSAGAKVAMPLDNMFWGERYGQVVDTFGHLWTLAMRIPMSAAEKEEKQRAAMAALAAGEHPGREA